MTTSIDCKQFEHRDLSTGRIINFVALLIFALIAVYFSFIHASYDSKAYEDIYVLVKSGSSVFEASRNNAGIDFGFVLITKIISWITPSYSFFRLVIFLLSFFFLHLTSRKIGLNHYAWVILYALYPFVYDSYQIEFFLAYALVAYALSIIYKKEKFWFLKSLPWLLISAFIHHNALPFLIVPVIFLFIGKGFLRHIYILLLTLFTALVFFSSINPFDIVHRYAPYLDNFLPISHYSSSSIQYQLSFFTKSILVLFYCSIFLYSYYLCKNAKSNNLGARHLYYLNSVSLIFVPLSLISLDLERYLRPFLVISFMCMFCAIKGKGNTINKNAFFKIIILALLVVRFCVHFGLFTRGMSWS